MSDGGRRAAVDLDQNATTPLDPRVLEAMLPHLRGHYGNPSSACRLGQRARAAVEDARARIGSCLGVAADEIVLTAGGTEADNLALRGVARARREASNHLITSAIEHHAVLATCQDLAALGSRLTIVPPDPDGVVALDALERALAEGAALVSVMTANNETGVVQPIGAIAEMARRRGVPVHTDAVQALGKIPFRPASLGVDLASFSAHKIGGPKGVGALYLKQGTEVAATLTGGHQERGRRAGTENVPGIVGFAVAVELATYQLQERMEQQARLRRTLEEGILACLPGVTVNGAGAPRVANTSSVSFRGVDGESVVLQLDLQGVCVSTGSACTTGEEAPSHVLLAMGVDPILAKGTIRFSLGKGTTETEIDFTVAQVVATIRRLRAVSSLA